METGGLLVAMIVIAMIGMQSLFVVIYLTLIRRHRNQVHRDQANNKRKGRGDGISRRKAESRIGRESSELGRSSCKATHSQNIAGDPVSDQSKTVDGTGQQLDQDSALGAMADSFSVGFDDTQQECPVSHLERYRRLRESKSSFWVSCDSRNAGTVGFCSASIEGKPHLTDGFIRACMDLAEINADCVRDSDSVTLNVIMKELCFGVLPYVLYATFVIMRNRLVVTHGVYSFPDRGFLLVLLRDQSDTVVQDVKTVSELLHCYSHQYSNCKTQGSPRSRFFSVIVACSNLQLLKSCPEPWLSFAAFLALFVANHPNVSEAMRCYEAALKRGPLSQDPTQTVSVNPELN